MEDKRLTVAFHYRNAPEAEGEAVTLAERLAAESDGYDSDTDPFDDSYSTSLSLVLPRTEAGV